MRAAVAAATVVLLGLSLSACRPAPEPLHIGFIGGLTGRVVDLGEAGRNGVMLAVEDINAAGGVGGRPVTVSYVDDAQDPATAKAAVRKLVEEKARLLIGPMTSAMAEALLPEIESAGLVTLSPTATASSLAGKDDMLLRVAPSVQSYTMQQARLDHGQGARRVAIVYDLGNRAFSTDWAKQYGAAMKQLGAEVVAEQSFNAADEATQGAALQALRGSAPDSLMIVASAVDTVRLIQLARQMGMNQRVSASSWAGTEVLIQLGGRAVEGMATAQLFDRDSPQPRYQAFAQRYRERFKQEAGFASVGAYDAALAGLQGLAKAPAGGAALKKALIDGGPYPGLQEEWRFDATGDTQRQVRIAVVRDGKFVVPR